MSPRRALLIAEVALLRVARDRVALFFIVALPLLVTFTIGFAIFRNIGALPLGVVEEDRGPLTRELVARLARSPVARIERYADAEALRRDVRHGTIAGGVVVPAGYDEALRTGGSAEVTFVLSPTRSAPEGLRPAVSAIVADEAARAQAAAFASGHAGVGFDDARGLVDEIRPDARVTVEPESVAVTSSRAVYQGFSYPASANTILFIFITAMAAAGGLISARKLGIDRRILATPTSVATLVAGHFVGRLTIGLLQGLVVVGAGALLFGARYGDPAGVAALVVSFALVATAVGIFLGTVLRTPEQASAIAPPLGIALGMLGGTMWPLEIVPQAMRTLGHVTPHAWAMDAFVALGRGADLAGIAPQLAVLGAFAAVLLPLATWRLRRVLVG